MEATASSTQASTRKIGLALSGGGLRAAAFHLGVLKYLAEHDQLEHIAHISSVSGGTLGVGLIYRCNEYRWPGSQVFLRDVLPKARRMLTTQSLGFRALLLLTINPLNWFKFANTGDILAQALQYSWGIKIPFAHLPEKPVWTINGTTGENGLPWRFRAGCMGNSQQGYASVDDLKLADAMAISAASPYGVGPLTLYPADFQWFRQPAWENPPEHEPVQPRYNRLHLYDGALNDRLGLEELFDAAQQSLNTDVDINYVMICDSGPPTRSQSLLSLGNPWRYKRMLAVALYRMQELRYRAFLNYIKVNPGRGVFLQLGEEALSCIDACACHHMDAKEALQKQKWLDSESIKRVIGHSLNLLTIDPHDFDLLVQHGYETALWNTTLEPFGFRSDVTIKRPPLGAYRPSSPETNYDWRKYPSF